MMKTKLLKDNESCSPGCANHVTHACERCGRVLARGQSILVVFDCGCFSGDYVIVPNGYDAAAVAEHVDFILSDSPSKLIN
jgi:hypothetical protein